MSNLEQFLVKRQQLNKTLTLATGVFDLLHEEHFIFLQKAKNLGDLLLVGLESDIRVRQMKGEGRPINKQEIRLENLQKSGIADFIFILPEEFSKPDDHRQLINKIRPDFMAVSSNTLFQAEKAKILAEFSAKLVVVHDFNPEFSSSKIIKK
jgi:D-beta-D-heptose 7-phosphate kinase/D-beta-D-heptose 1-phosphate adenosyltransferase